MIFILPLLHRPFPRRHILARDRVGIRGYGARPHGDTQPDRDIRPLGRGSKTFDRLFLPAPQEVQELPLRKEERQVVPAVWQRCFRGADVTAKQADIVPSIDNMENPGYNVNEVPAEMVRSIILE